MGRIEEIETGMERIQQEMDRSGSACVREKLEQGQQELLDELDSLQDLGLPEGSDTNELP